ncbi:MAG: hypothetical protein C4B59_06965 [Candidatus Methanogaster sp.]|uniref:Uncharacterized protein n=1 Tax=Candidatus Methanogaster sp. TaxID=3386292 RepID=A0AC61L3S0_9EURY|nr:MAG: hypothetical protein C4B59_06965 [ANME-2 cluster archaeon]
MKTAFVIMPFDDEIANDVYELITKPICNEFDLEVRRADEIFTPNPILDDIVAAIEESTVIIVDISGKNPNVFYELGMSHMLKRTQTIIITHDECNGTPFDIAHFRIIKYENTISGKAIYENQLKRTLEHLLRDYKIIYEDVFELMINVLMSDEVDESSLYALMALTKAPMPLHKHDPLHVEGHYKDGGWVTSESRSAESKVSQFIELGYAKVSGDIVILTDKGKAFIDLLDERGFVCDFVNGHILSEGYVPHCKWGD